MSFEEEEDIRQSGGPSSVTSEEGRAVKKTAGGADVLFGDGGVD